MNPFIKTKNVIYNQIRFITEQITQSNEIPTLAITRPLNKLNNSCQFCGVVAAGFSLRSKITQSWFSSGQALKAAAFNSHTPLKDYFYTIKSIK